MPGHNSDFKSIRQWRGSQHQAFEELCYQLRGPTPNGADLVKTGNPDGGLEWYVTRRNGVQWGWQAKFTFDINTLLTLMEKSLRTVVEKRPNCRKLTFCIPFDLPDAPGNGERKSARQKFEDRKKSWRSRIPGANRVRIELWSEGALLERLAQHPGRRGIEWFFWNRDVFSPEWCARRLEITVDAAGERYRPDLHVDLPVAFALEGLALSDAYWQRFGALRDAVLSAVKQIAVSRYTGLGVTSQLRTLVRSLAEWEREVPICVDLPRRLDQDRLLDLTRTCHSAADATYPHDPSSDERHSRLQYYLHRLTRTLRDFEELLRSGATEAAQHGALLLTGEAGQGKTHLLCDVGQRAVQANRPALVLLGGRFSGRQVWSDIAEQLGLGHIGSEELLGGMQAAAEASGAPFLLLIDALNEAADPTAWQEELPGLLAEVAQNPWISLGISVRSTFRKVVLPPDGLSSIAQVEHPGFKGRELEATEQFFDIFGLEQPRIPLLTPDFTNPLFLKLYCEGLKGLGLSAPPVGTDHLSDVFERYLTWKQNRIVSRLQLDPETRPVEKAIDAFCKALADNNRDSLPRAHCSEIINTFAPECQRWPDTLFGQLLSEGVLTADIARHPSTYEPVQIVRFTYQRFADHRVVTTLLKPLNRDPARLRRALEARKPLRKRVLKAPVSWIEALAVQLPEQFGIELLDAARWRLDPFTRDLWDQAFVQSLATRRPSAVTQRARELLSHVQRRSGNLRGLVIETLLTISPLPQHPLNANMLHNRLKSWSMPLRDIAWSIPTYYTLNDGGALDRLIRWAARGPYPNYPDEVIELAAIPLVWTFTSPNRHMRDYATKALTRLLAGSLSVLSSLIRRFDGVNDPYVVERLAVVSHGAVLCDGRAAPQAAVAVAHTLKQVALAESQLPNLITRDAVRGIYEWCVRHNLVDALAYTEMLPPYGSAPPETPRTQEELKRAYDRERYHGENVPWPYSEIWGSIFNLGDFGHYVIASKLEKFSPYPLSSPRPPLPRPRLHSQVTYPGELGQRWVFERVLSLGWTPERFATFDRSRPGHWTRSDHKPERFGKKYQWIAFRELLARVADNFHMRNDFNDQSVTYAGPWQFFGRDIDPTLPPPPRLHNEDDELTLHPTFPPDDAGWWKPPELRYRPDEAPVEEGWAVESGDIPELEPLIRKKEKSGARWVVLCAYYDWIDKIPEDKEGQSWYRRDLRSLLFSWLVRPSDRETLVSFLEQRSLMERWMPEGYRHIDDAYLGELPWATATGEEPNAWHAIWPRGAREPLEFEVYPTWAEYGWEGNVLDCSIQDSVNAWLPAPILFEAETLNWVPGTRQWCRPNGKVVAQYREGSGHSALLVREEWLKRILRRTGNAIIFGWLGEKRLFETGFHPRIVGDWTQIDTIASFAGSQWAFGERRLKRRSTGDQSGSA